MFTVPEAFQKFIEKLELTDTDRKKVSDQHTLLREVLRKRLSLKNDFLTGSYKRHTAIRPLNDVDIFVVFDDSGAAPTVTPESVLLRVRDALHAEWSNKEVIRVQPHSVRITFAGTGVGYDLVPAFKQPWGYFIPERRVNQEGVAQKWIKTDPEKHEASSTAANETSVKALKPLLKAVKHWKEISKSSPLGSFHLEVMSFSAFSRKPISPLEGLATLFEHLSNRVMTPCPEPSGLNPDPIDSGMTDNQRKAAQQLLSGAASQVRLAIKSIATDPSSADAHDRLKKLFDDQYQDH